MNEEKTGEIIITQEIPLVYLWIYKKFCDKWGRYNVIVFTKDIEEIIRRTVYQIPKKYDQCIIKELERFELIENINQHKFKLNGSLANKKLKKLDNYFAW